MPTVSPGPTGFAAGSAVSTGPDWSAILRKVAGRHISVLQRRYRADQSTAVAEIAVLRRGVGKAAYIGDGGADALEDLVHEFPSGNRQELERAEDALYLTLTLWALHQQSVRDANMHAPGINLGAAVRQLAHHRAGRDAEIAATFRQRFARLGTSSSLFPILATRLREFVLLLRDARIALDYGQLSADLFTWQNVIHRDAIRRSWGRAFHHAAVRTEGAPDESQPEWDPGE